MLNKALATVRKELDEKCTEKKVNKIPEALAIRDALFDEERQDYNGIQIERRFDNHGKMFSCLRKGNLTYMTQKTDSGSPWATIANYTNTKIMWITQKHETKWKRWVGLLANGELYQFDTGNYGCKWRIRYAHLLEPITETAPAAEPETGVVKSHDFFKGLLDEFVGVTDEVIARMDDLIQRGVTRISEDDVTFFSKWKKDNTEILEVAMALTVILNNIDTSIKYFNARTYSSEAIKNSEFTDLSGSSEEPF